MSKDHAGRPAMRAVATAIDEGHSTRASIQDCTGRSHCTVHHACNKLLRRGWIANVSPNRHTSVYRLAVPLEDVLAELEVEPAARGPKIFDARPLQACWPLPVMRWEVRA